MKIIPTGDRLLIKMLKIETSKGGIFLPQKMQMLATVGEIIATGPGYLSDEKNEDGSDKWEETEHKVGEKVLFYSKAGVVINDQYRLLHDRDVLAVVSDDGAEVGDLFID